MSLEGSDRTSRKPEDPLGKGIERGSSGLEFELGRDFFFPLLLPPLLPREPDNAQSVSAHAPVPDRAEIDRAHCTLVVPIARPGGSWFQENPLQKEAEIPNVPIIETSYDGFKIAMEMGGFMETRGQGDFYRIRDDDGLLHLGNIRGDFKRRSTVSKKAMRHRRIKFPGLIAEYVMLNSVHGWSNFVIFSNGLGEDKGKYVLAELDMRLYRTLEQYPLKTIVQNPFARYLPLK